MAVLRRALGDEQAARRAYAAIHTYTIGFAALEASRSGWQPAGDKRRNTGIGPPRGAAQKTVAENPDLILRLAAYTTPDQFRQGFNFLLEGIQRDATKH